jgi:nicotinamidase-related amidase
MNEKGASDRPALLVIDLQTAMFHGALFPPIYDADALVARVRAVIAWARRNGYSIGFIRHDGPSGDELAPGEPGWPLWPALGRADDEPIFSKNVGDAFSGPELCAWLAEHGTRNLILTGAQTDECVAATVHGAQERGFAVTVVGDAHSTWDSGSETAVDIIARHNAAFAKAGARIVSAGELIAT